MESQPQNIVAATSMDGGLWEEIVAAASNRKERINAWILLGVSLFLFTGLGAFAWDLPSAAMLMVAIFIHELGHVLGMKLFRYKNVKMLFIPLFGGAAIGTPDKQDAFRIAMISILGPLFGLLSCYFALAIWVFVPQEFLIKYAYLSLFINAFNLLPILPLDGGHFMNETLFSRFPKAELVFNIVAVIALAYIAYEWSSWAMGFLAVIWLIATPTKYKLGKIAAKLRKEKAVVGGEITKENASIIKEELEMVLIRSPHGISTKALATYIHNVWEKINKKFLSIPMTMFMLFVYLMVTCVFTIATALCIESLSRWKELGF